MASKRGASSELNHENWDREDEPEEAGTFQKASEESLKNRIIKTARRRNPISKVSENLETKSVFTNIAFNKPKMPATSSFQFLTNLTGKIDTKKDSEHMNQKPSESFSFTANSLSNGKSNDYLSKLKGLNENISKWIKQHVDANPFVNLQPVFDDYKKYFQDIESNNVNTVSDKKESIKTLDCSSSKSNLTFKPAETPSKDLFRSSVTTEDKSSSIFSNGSISTPSFGFSTTSTSNTFSFVSNTSTTTSSTPSSQAFGSYPSNVQSNGFTFSKPLSTTTSVAVPSTGDTDKEEDDAPPKVEFTPVIETDHLYSIRCKVFVKKDGTFGDRGIGNLYLKSIDNTEKVQLIVRADTNLGNLLCNFILSESIPIQRMGKKDVMLVCLPTPDFKPPPVPILLRVKTPEEADSLLDTLEKHKK